MGQVIGQVFGGQIRCREILPLTVAGHRPIASASAEAAAADWATEQMPQMRGTMASASSGARPTSSCSKPRTAAN
jgi:hypothetical protein